MEKITSKKASLEVLISMFDYHTKMFPNALADISDKDAQNRLDTKANHVAWLAGSLVYQRQFLANALGINVKQTSEKLFENHKGIQDNITYPSLEEYKQDWRKISRPLKDALKNLSEEQLNGESCQRKTGNWFSTMESLIDYEVQSIDSGGL